MEAKRFLPYEETVVLAAGVENRVVVKGESHEGLRRVLIESLSYDEAKVAGATVQDVQVKVIPRKSSDAYGGDMFHTFYAEPTPGSNNRHTLGMGFYLLPGEDLTLTFKSAAGGTIRYRLRRVLEFA